MDDDAVVEEVPVEEPVVEAPKPKAKAKKRKELIAVRDKTGRIVFE